MRDVNLADLATVNGGNPMVGVIGGIGASLATYNYLPDMISAFDSSTQIYAQWGEALSERFFEYNHPNQLGQMVYTIDDFR